MAAPAPARPTQVTPALAALAAPFSTPAPPPPPPIPSFVPPPISDAAATPVASPLQGVTGKAAVYGRCAWDDLLLGALPAWATLTILCTCAFLVGCLLTGLLARWRHNAAFYGDGAAARAADAEALPSPASEFVGRRRPDAFKTPGTLAKEDAVRAAGVTGPLGVGAVVGSLEGGGSGDGGRAGLPRAALAGRRASAAGSSHPTPAVRTAYEVEDLDEEWRALVAEVDARLVSRRAKPCDARERSAVVRALLASGPAEPAEVALDRAARTVREGRGGRGVV